MSKPDEKPEETQNIYTLSNPRTPPQLPSLPLHPPSTNAPSRWPSITKLLKTSNHRFETLTGLETRGISRVPLSDRQPITHWTHLQAATLWLSADLTATSTTLALLGPLVYNLSFLDAALCAVCGACIGSLGPAYIATWGPRSGHRTMILARFFVGRWTSKVLACLTLVVMLGYGTLNCIIAGQIVAAVADGHGLGLVPGILVVSSITLVIAVFGTRAFHAYSRYTWVPQLVILLILIGSAAPKFDIITPSSSSRVANRHDVVGNRLSFLALCASSPLAWISCAADYFVYFPPHTPKRWLALATHLANALAFSIAYIIGVGLASGVSTNPSWSIAYATSPGALLLAGFAPLGTFGQVCGVILALGVVADNIAATYSAGLVLQVLGLERAPRWVLTVFVVGTYTGCAIGGRDALFEIFGNFLAMMGYWTAFFAEIMVEEQALFRYIRRRRVRLQAHETTDEDDADDDDGYEWEAWRDWRDTPLGLASLIAFLFGWAGAIISMKQRWYTGPLAKFAGGDLGLWVGTCCTLVSYPILRMVEVEMFER